MERSGVQSTSTSHLPTDNAQKLSQIGLESSINSLRMHAGHIFATLTNFCELFFFRGGEISILWSQRTNPEEFSFLKSIPRPEELP